MQTLLYSEEARKICEFFGIDYYAMNAAEETKLERLLKKLGEVSRDEGYKSGYGVGYDEGYNVGYDVGYDEGYSRDQDE